MDQHPVRRLLDAGVPLTLSTDDPGIFRCTLSGEFQAAASLGITPAEARQMIANASKFRFAPRP